MRGIQVTNGSPINYAQDDDFVLNTRFVGGMKISEKKIFIPRTDFTTVVSPDYYQIVYPHKLPYVPAVIAFQGGIQAVGWQNSATIEQASANADARNVYIISDYAIPDIAIYLIIFQEKVADA